MKVLFVARMLHQVSGGVERMAVRMMNEMGERGHEVELFTWDVNGAESYYLLNSRVVWHCLNIGDARRKAGWLIRAKRQLVIRNLLKRARPDMIIAFQHGPFLTVAMAALGLGIPIIAAERNAPHRFDHLKAGSWRNLIFQTFRLADRITVQWQEYVERYPRYLRPRIVSIPNPVSPAVHLASPRGKPGSEKRLLCVGRLSYQKNQSVLIEAFGQISTKLPEWKLVLVGSGEDEEKLKQLVEERNLSDRVDFVGITKDIDQVYVGSHLFCLPSRWEGFPNALAEAMVHGLPVIGYAGCAGVSQLITHGHTGILVEGNGSVENLAGGLEELMKNNDLRHVYGTAAVDSMKRFEPLKIFDRWEGLFSEVSGGS